jgi:hypothetical protein
MYIMANSSDKIPVEPYNLVRTHVITSIDIRIVNLILFKSVTLAVGLYSANGYVCDNRTFEISGDEYLAWNNDDSYLINLVMTKLGVTPVPK